MDPLAVVSKAAHAALFDCFRKEMQAQVVDNDADVAAVEHGDAEVAVVEAASASCLENPVVLLSELVFVHCLGRHWRANSGNR